MHFWYFPSKHFNIGSTLFLGWYDVATSHNIKSTLKQRCVRQRWNLQRSTTSNVANMTIWKKIKPWVKNKIIFLCFKNTPDLKSSSFFPILRGICKRIFAGPQKFLKHRIYWITKTIFKPSHFVKCQLVFNFTRREVQAHYGYRSFNFICIF